MQNPHGQIVSMSGDRHHRQVVVEVESVTVCDRCESGKGCGAGLLGKRAGTRCLDASVAENLDLGVGDLVSVALLPRNVLRAAAIVYGYPLSGAVSAAVAAHAAGLGDIAAALVALCGLVAGVLLARVQLRNAGCLRDFTPVVVERLSEVRN